MIDVESSDTEFLEGETPQQPSSIPNTQRMLSIQADPVEPWDCEFLEGEPPVQNDPIERTIDASMDTGDLAYPIPERTVHLVPSTSSPREPQREATTVVSPEPEREVVKSIKITARPNVPDVTPSTVTEERGHCRGYQYMPNARRLREHEEQQDEEQRNR